MGFEHGFVPFVGFGSMSSIDFGYKMLNMLNMFEHFVSSVLVGKFHTHMICVWVLCDLL